MVHGKWQGDRYIQSDRYNYTAQLCRKYKATENFGSFPVTVNIYRVNAVFQAVI